MVCRVIALLECYVRKCPDSPLLPTIVPPLLQALSRAARSPDNKALVERLRVCTPVLADDHFQSILSAPDASRVSSISIACLGVQALLANKLCKSKAEAAGAATEGAALAQLLKAVLYATAREPDKAVVQAGCASFLYLLRAAGGRSGSDALAPEVRTGPP